VDCAILLAIVAGWMICVALVTGGRRVVLWDTYRDMAWAENIRAGRLWADPTLPDQPYWYAPGSALLVGGLSRLTGLGVIDLYTYIAYWLNAFVPLMLYVLVRVVWNRTTAIIALLTVYLGSLMWLTHAAAAIPSIQGVALNLAALLCWHRCVVLADGTDSARGRSWIWTLIGGGLLALSAWYHPLCALMVAGAIFLHAVVDAFAPGLGRSGDTAGRFALTCRMLVIGVAAGILSAPLTMHMIAVQGTNPALVRYFAEELLEPDYYAQSLAPLVVPCAMLGIWLIARHTPRAIWIVTYLAVGLAGQLMAFVAQVPGCEMPFLLPHEFVWHGQLALGVCAAVGIVWLATRLAELTSRAAPRLLAKTSWAAALLLVVVAPGARGLARADRYLMDVEPLLAHTAELRAWIRANTMLDAVFVCPPDAGYRIVAGMTGRKCIASSPGHTNPLVDFQRRHDDVKAMLEAVDPAEFSRLAARYNATHLLLVTEPWDRTQVARPDYEAWPCLRLVFVSSDGTSAVWRIAPSQREPAEQTAEPVGRL